MIQHVRLRQWRSYDELDLALGPGTTFVVAPNGVGKTSLVLGLAWALFGEHADVEPRSCIRAGADTAEVELSVLLADGRELIIIRQVARRGRPTLRAQLDHADIDEATLDEVLRTAFQVDLDVAANLSMMLGGGQLASEQPLDLKSHLYTAFGVAGLLRTAETAERLAKEAEKQRAAVRATEQDRLADRTALETQLASIEEQLRVARSKHEELQAGLREADRERKMSQQVAVYQAELSRYDNSLGGLVERARELVADDLDEDDIETALRADLQRSERQVDVEAEAYATARGAAAAATEALGALTGADAYCPTCLRPIDASEVEAATVEHEHRLDAATEATERHARGQSALRARSAELVQLLTQLDSLRRPAPPEFEVDPAAAEARHAAALEALEIHNQNLGVLQSQVQQLTSQLSADDRIAEAQRALRQAYHREAITTVAASAFRRTAAEITENLIEPIAAEVTWRWKRLFENGGLSLRSDGTIVREEQGEELGWSTLSDGERIWARIVVHLLVIAASTRLPFVWFDEPLEHLDPQLRHAVAATLASATQGGSPGQLLVTTYEHALARQLADDTREATLVNVRSGKIERPRNDPTTSDTPPQVRPSRPTGRSARRAS